MSNQTKRSVLITGCSQGSAGNALALEFASKGFRVFATARSQKTLDNLREKGIETLVLDITSAESIRTLVEEITTRTQGRLDILYNNAGISYKAPAVEADPSRVRSIFDTNVFGLMEMVTAFTPLLLASVAPNNVPTIVNVASVLARLPNLFTSAYNASKAAVALYSDTLRLEVQPLGIRVVTLFMGEVSTPMISGETINFGPDSLYRDVEESIKARTATRVEDAMRPAEFARQVVGTVNDGKTTFVWKGSNAFLIWLLNAVGPRTVFDNTLMKRAGLDTAEVKSSIFKLGQDRATKSA
ncbi:uncharacterized protein TRIVIDRAFT_60168 [Trichoderma virens Gv29-8]|uniref:Uncharacterized protein n=1 Tax=Hypocrea virens (strain Gv29-8 / FGSC 10586) TaxID=413071 RepID=G9MSL0_HYPVG|nr:uncharacterized protein TRIVIDRAFT_60168 [Trichoderma virens Gv29-8]EHK23013.1 hypothetical protein TRIVIDRAFT_60168 [Trichoderma virens Gv29-8]UKZ48073.1 putative secondary metabolism biosynthetic enzyme [Trichoderma virens]